MRWALVSVVVAAVVAVVAAGASGAPADAPDMTFYPQAGILWQDLYVNNFVDLDPGPGVRDFACGSQTYDGHTGQDSDIRSFREMDIGVPVFAALDGRVIQVTDGEFDRNHGSMRTQFDNNVVIEHGPGRFTVYGHLRRGVLVRRLQEVRAGQQIGWTASSGNSTWPHLHFTSRVGGEVHEPFSGPCRAGESGWTEQAPLPTEPYLRDLAVAARPFTGRRALPFDLGVRTGTFVRGIRTVHVRAEFGVLDPDARVRFRWIRPDGSVALDRARGAAFPVYHGRGDGTFSFRLALRQLGRWRFVLEADGRVLADAPVRVVASAARVRNRPPRAVAAALHPGSPSSADVLQCRLRTSLATEDPDFDIVRYRYRWTAGGRVLRTVTSAALSDVLRVGLVRSAQQVACSVTPSDGRASGPSVRASAVVR
jgi:Peptidase family M23